MYADVYWLKFKCKTLDKQQQMGFIFVYVCGSFNSTEIFKYSITIKHYISNAILLFCQALSKENL